MDSAKLVYKLCVDKKLSSNLFTKIIQKHQKNYIVASRKWFNFEIRLNKTNKFTLNNFSFSFLHDNNIEYKSLKCHNKKILTPKEKKSIIRAINNIADDINITQKQILGIFSIASLIKCYIPKYKYIFVPFTMFYGVDFSTVHQCAFLVDSAGYMIFYEPYGVYEKYSLNYENIMQDFFSIFSPILPDHFFKNKKINYKNFHQIINQPIGLQTIIMKINNKKYENNKLQYEAIAKEIEDIYGIVVNEDNGDDKSKHVLDLLHKVFLTGEIHDELLKFYMNHTSQTCVSITMVELDAFFSGNNLTELYNSDNPNLLLFSAIHKLYKELIPNHKLHIN